MRLALAYIGILVGATGATAAVGYRSTRDHWGAGGVASMVAASVICAAAAVLAAIPVAVLAARRSRATPQACLAATAIRLLVTGLLAMVYQTRAAVHLVSFLAWLLIVYLTLLIVETAFNVFVIQRRCLPPPDAGR